MSQKGQQGVAAIEFALVLGVLMLLVYGTLAFGLLFWMQQKLSHVAGDSARHAVIASMAKEPDPAQMGCNHVAQHVSKDWLLASLGAQHVSCTPSAAQQSCPDDPDASCASIVVVADVSQWPVLILIRGLTNVVRAADSLQIIQQLSATAIVRVRRDAVL